MSAMLDYLNARAIARATIMSINPMPVTQMRLLDVWTIDYFCDVAALYPGIISHDDMVSIRGNDLQTIRNVLAVIDEVA